MTRWASPRAGIAVSVLAIEQVRGSLHLVRIAMILLLARAVGEIAFWFLSGFYGFTFPVSSRGLAIVAYAFGVSVTPLTSAIWLLVAIAAIRLRTAGATGFARGLDAIVCLVLAVQMALVAGWLRGRLASYVNVEVLTVPMEVRFWWTGAAVLFVLGTMLVLGGRRLDALMPGLRTGLIILLAGLSGWWIADLAGRELKGGPETVAVVRAVRWIGRIIPLVLVAVLGMLVHRINARLYGRLCSRRMFVVTLAVAGVFTAGWWLARLALVLLALVERPGDVSFRLRALAPLFAVAFAAWMLIAVRHARRRLASYDTCLECGYDLKGIGATRCPECGHEVEPGPLVRVT